MALKKLPFIIITLVFVALLTPGILGLSCHTCEYIMDNGVVTGDDACHPSTAYELPSTTLRHCDPLRNSIHENENATHILTCVKTYSSKDDKIKVKRSCFNYKKSIWGATADSSAAITRCDVVTSKDEDKPKSTAIWPYVRGAGDKNIQWNENDIEACFCNEGDGCNSSQTVAFSFFTLIAVVSAGIFL